MLDGAKLKKFVDQCWGDEIVPTLVEYIKIPNKSPLFDPDWAPGQAPNEIGRRPFGQIVIANSDSGAGAYTSVAIDQAHRAITDLATT